MFLCWLLRSEPLLAVRNMIPIDFGTIIWIDTS